jgi:hypothetical protein
MFSLIALYLAYRKQAVPALAAIPRAIANDRAAAGTTRRAA